MQFFIIFPNSLLFIFLTLLTPKFVFEFWSKIIKSIQLHFNWKIKCIKKPQQSTEIFSAPRIHVIFFSFEATICWDVSGKRNEIIHKWSCNKCKQESWNVYNHKGINHIKWTTFDVNYFKVKIINIYLKIPLILKHSSLSLMLRWKMC